MRGRSRRAIRAARAHILEAPPRQQLPQHDAQRIDVGAAVRLRPVPDLGGRVRRPSDDVPRAGQRRVHVRTRDPEIDQLHLARKRQHDVVGRDVAVDDSEIAERVRVGKGARDFGDDVDRDGERHALARGGQARLQQPDVDAVYELLQQQQLAVDLLDADGLRDCAVRKLERDVGLAPETRVLLLRTELGVHPLEHAQLGDSARLRAQAEVDSSHAARTGSAQQEIGPQPAEIRHHPPSNGAFLPTKRGACEPLLSTIPIALPADERRRSGSRPRGTGSSSRHCVCRVSFGDDNVPRPSRSHRVCRPQ